jgi:hypothetical protein
LLAGKAQETLFTGQKKETRYTQDIILPRNIAQGFLWTAASSVSTRMAHGSTFYYSIGVTCVLKGTACGRVVSAFDKRWHWYRCIVGANREMGVRV